MTTAETHSTSEYSALLRADFASFAQQCFRELNPRSQLALSWFHDIIAAKLEAVRTGRSRRLIINMPPRHLKSHLASVCFPAWCLGHDPSAQLLCVSYAQDLADKLSRDCRQIVASNWYRQLCATRLSAQRQAMSEFETTAQGIANVALVLGPPRATVAGMSLPPGLSPIEAGRFGLSLEPIVAYLASRGVTALITDLVPDDQRAGGWRAPAK